MSSFDLVASLLAIVLAALGVAKLLALAPMRAAAAHVGVSVDGYRAIGALEVAAALGLVVGRSWFPLGAASAGGVVLLMVGAVVAHARAGDSVRNWVPAVGTAALAATYVALFPGGMP
jgi:hypothetical protein